jgi:hypothetical protein
MLRNLPVCALLTVLGGVTYATLAAAPPWDLGQPYRVEVVVGSAGYARRDLPVETEVDFAALLKDAGAPGAVQPASLRVVEVNDKGVAVDADVPYQLDAPAPGQKGALVFLLKGATAARAARRYHVYFDTAGSYRPPAQPAPVKLTDGVEHQGQESYRIETPAATYLYHKAGAGFASLNDKDGNDWLSFRPTGGSAGHYRGIPNAVHPEGYFHPGGRQCTSRIEGQGPLRLRIASASQDGQWACRWDIYPAFARLTMLKAAHPYWFLYEGTPGGRLDEDGDYYVLSTGEKRPASARWDRDIPAPEWLYFGDRQLGRVLCLAHHEDDDHPDAYYPMEKNMTVFGFGRSGLKKFLEHVPAHFTVALYEETAYERVKAFLDGVTRPLEVKLGKVEGKGRP